MKRSIFSVYQVTRYIKALLEEDCILDSVFIEGEVSNLKLHGSGHIYFTLKDEKSALGCVMFKNYAASAFLPQNGMKIVAYGRISLYEKIGQYQLYAEALEPWGKGSLQAAFEQTKEKLYKEGLFDEKHKKPIPQNPACIAVITSPTGAAVRDIIQIVKRRNKCIELVIVSTLVQGENAAKEIAQAVKDANDWGGCEIIIIARGGGSLEDLWPFNSEQVARAVFSSKIPVISAIGHETDYTITDFTADLRVPTPSAAAELAAPDLEELRFTLEAHKGRISQAIGYKLQKHRSRLEYLSKRCSLRHLMEDIYNKQIYINTLYKNLNREMEYRLNGNKDRLIGKTMLLESLSPLGILKRGYIIAYDKNGNIIKRADNTKEGDIVRLCFSEGEAAAEVISVNTCGNDSQNI